MLKKFIKYPIVVMTVLFLLAIPSSARVSAACSGGPLSSSCSAQAACQGLGAGSGSGCSKTSGSGLSSLVSDALNILSLIIGVAAVFMIVIGGFRFVVSGGDSNATASARNTIIYALVGLVVAAFAQFIVHFVLNRVT
jgi:hypothetical protein